MNKELTMKLVKRFPVMYQNFYSGPQETCMCWGFDHGDGWFDIIWQLSLAIEKELGYTRVQKRWFLFKKRFFKRWNAWIYSISPPVQPKYRREGSGIPGDPIRMIPIPQPPPPYGWLKRFVCWPNTGLAVDQVKEKFGTLRFYCLSNDAIDHHIHHACERSAATCEVCGEPGRVRGSHWIQTLCNVHAPKDVAEEAAG